MIPFRHLGPVALLFAAPLAYAHEVDGEPSRQAVLHTWTWSPLVVIALVLSAMLYAVGAMRLKRRSADALRWWEIACFAAGWLVLALSLLSPLHALGEQLFSAHMTQHELLMIVAAPLLVLGRPLVPLLFALPQAWRERLGALSKISTFSRSWHAVTGPVVAWTLQAAVILVWHLPVLYQATLRSEAVHALQHTSFIVAALLFWWALVHGRYGRMGYGAAVLYVFTTSIYTGALGALLTVAPRLWYPIYGNTTAQWGLTPFEDQQLAGLIMWIPAGVVLLVVGLALFAAWVGESGRRVELARSAALIGRHV
jgi:putative membrane protein